MNTSGCDLIAAERQRQLEQEEWTLEHDDLHWKGELALAAVAYASSVPVMVQVPYREYPHWVDPWPFEQKWDRHKSSTRIRLLVKAGALIAAHIDRLQRLA